MIRVLTNARVFDGVSRVEGISHVVIEEDRIREVAHSRPSFSQAEWVDCGGRYLMPGLIDAHFHAYSPSFDIAGDDLMPPALMASHARAILEGALQRGFTTVRDAGGADIGLSLAVDQGLIQGPRLFFSGRALSQTGGHGDIRRGDRIEPCGCIGHKGLLSVVADGADEVRKAAREELRRGAHQIKIFVSGGVLSPSDPIWMPSFTDEEIRAAVHEAGTRRTYVMAHCHTDEDARRCVANGVRSIEHGTLIERDETAAFIASQGAYVVPTLSIVDVLREHAAKLPIPREALDKLRSVGERMFQAIETCSRAGVKLGFGTDLLGHEFHPRQGGELELRGRVSESIDVLRSATSVNAALLQREADLGHVRPGAFADLLVLNGDPFSDLALFRSTENLPLVMKGGAVVRNRL